MRLIQYDMLPVNDGWALRCAANGRIVMRSVAEESARAFEGRCRLYCMDKATEARQVELSIHDEHGYVKARSGFAGTTEGE